MVGKVDGAVAPIAAAHLPWRSGRDSSCSSSWHLLDGVHEGDLPGAAPQVGYMQAGVGRALVKKRMAVMVPPVSALNETPSSTGRRAHYQSLPHNRARPDGLLAPEC